MTEHLPDDLEERVRDAYRSAARTVHTLQRPVPELGTRTVAPRRRVRALAPLAAAAAVILIVAGSVALPRLLTSGAQKPQSSAPAAGRPPFLVLASSASNTASRLVVESAATGHTVSSMGPPRKGLSWVAVAATANPARFIVAAEPMSAPYTTYLYRLSLSARGTMTGLNPLAVPTLPGELYSLAASADGRTVAYTMSETQAVPNAGEVRPSGWVTGVITGGTTRQWSVAGTAVQSISRVSVSGNGKMLAFITQSLAKNSVEDTAWLLPSGAAAGSLTAQATPVRNTTYVGGAGYPATILQSTLLSPDGGTLYLSLIISTGTGATRTAVTTYRLDGRSLGAIGAIAGWKNAYPAFLSPVGGMLLCWDPSSSLAYLINPANGARTTVRLSELSHGQYLALAW